MDFQKERIESAPISVSKDQRSVVLNYGIDFLVKKDLDRNINTYIGIGYFRNKFNFKRFYAHRLLNIGTDSIPLGTSTSSYTYNLARIPFGISIDVNMKQKIAFKVSGELIMNYSFNRIYNGSKPFPTANNKLSVFSRLGNSINLFGRFKLPINRNNFIEVEPYLRVFNIYKKDEILFEDSNQKNSRKFDAFGISTIYILNN